MAQKPNTQKPRAIFEEVATSEKIAANPGVIDGGRRDGRHMIRIWLAVLFVMVAAMIIVGGLTRLTDSGLSITEWNPLRGAIPPLTHEDWLAEFELYRASPQYLYMNQGMELLDFQFIYWWEWGHRQLGRAVGLVWGLGLLFFIVTKRVPAGWLPRLIFIGALGGMQGAVGWWMVHSGLQGEMTSVASYRLATHLCLAFAIFGFIGWYFFQLKRTDAELMVARRGEEKGLYTLSMILVFAAFFQMFLGALVAGIDAGRAFPTWPDMGGSFFPPYPFDLQPVWRNFFENAGLVQFIHRMAGYLLFAYGIFVFVKSRKSPHPKTRNALTAMLIMMVLQVALGIFTVLYSAPLDIAITHQIGAVVLFVLAVYSAYLARYPEARSLRG